MDISTKAKETGFTLPVTIDPALVEQLEPNTYLTSLGITFDQRLTNLLQIAHAYLLPSQKQGEFIEQAVSIPFMVLRGPLVNEAFIPVTAIVHSGENGKPIITLTKATSDEESV